MALFLPCMARAQIRFFRPGLHGARRGACMALVFQIICRGARTMARFCLRACLDGWWVVDGYMSDVWVT